MPGRPAGRGHVPARSKVEPGRQEPGLDRGRDLELPFELGLLGALLEQHAGLERDRRLIEESA